MDSSSPSQSTTVAGDSLGVNAPIVDPFLVEALQNPRHRLTTHRVAQHYGLPTMVQDNLVDGQGTRIMVRKIAESIYPAICLSEIPVKQSENDKLEQKKIVIRPRPGKASLNGPSELGKRSSIRTVEERKEEYDRARARIFSSPSSPESEDTVSRAPVDGKNVYFTGDENEGSRNAVTDLERNFSGKDGIASSRVAIFRDREKDRTDPDYDRSYDRYVRNLPSSQNFNLTPFNMQEFPPPYLQYESVFPQLGQMPITQASLGYRSPIMSPYAIGPNQTSRDPVLMQWPFHATMYTESYDQFRHAVFQAPFCQQPLSFDYSQNH